MKKLILFALLLVLLAEAAMAGFFRCFGFSENKIEKNRHKNPSNNTTTKNQSRKNGNQKNGNQNNGNQNNGKIDQAPQYHDTLKRQISNHDNRKVLVNQDINIDFEKFIPNYPDWITIQEKNFAPFVVLFEIPQDGNEINLGELNCARIECSQSIINGRFWTTATFKTSLITSDKFKKMLKNKGSYHTKCLLTEIINPESDLNKIALKNVAYLSMLPALLNLEELSGIGLNEFTELAGEEFKKNYIFRIIHQIGCSFKSINSINIRLNFLNWGYSFENKQAEISYQYFEYVFLNMPENNFDLKTSLLSCFEFLFEKEQEKFIILLSKLLKTDYKSDKIPACFFDYVENFFSLTYLEKNLKNHVLILFVQFLCKNPRDNLSKFTEFAENALNSHTSGDLSVSQLNYSETVPFEVFKYSIKKCYPTTRGCLDYFFKFDLGIEEYWNTLKKGQK